MDYQEEVTQQQLLSGLLTKEENRATRDCSKQREEGGNLLSLNVLIKF